GEVALRPGSEVEHELVAVAQFHQPGGVGLGAAHERPPGSQRDDTHFVAGQRLGVWEIVVAPATHSGYSRSDVSAIINALALIRRRSRIRALKSAGVSPRRRPR